MVAVQLVCRGHQEGIAEAAASTGAADEDIILSGIALFNPNSSPFVARKNIAHCFLLPSSILAHCKEDEERDSGRTVNRFSSLRSINYPSGGLHVR